MNMMEKVVTLTDNTGRKYFAFPKSEVSCGEAILWAAKRSHKAVTDMVAKCAVDNGDDWDVMTSKGDYWCVTRKAGR